MPPKIVVSYDGTANEEDAVSLGALFARAGADVGLAYVRHAHEDNPSREDVAEAEAEEMLSRGAKLLGDENAPRHVVTDRSTPEGLGSLAASEGAEVIVFCSDSHTAKGHIAVGNSAQRLMEGGTVAVAVAPVDLAEQLTARAGGEIVAIGDADGGARETAESLASALGSTVGPVVNDRTVLLVVDSRPEALDGRIAISASASHLIENATCPVLVLPRGRSVAFGRAAQAA